MSTPGPVMEAIGRLAYGLTQIQPLFGTELHIILAALFPIVAAAHASLSRPSSAAKPQPREKKAVVDQHSDDEEEEDEDDFQRMEGFSRTDAIYMPLFAGAVLTGLYFLIKWLKDLDLLNKILNWYFSAVGLFSVCKLIADVLRVGHSFVFPKWYADGEGVWQVKSTPRKTVHVNADKSIDTKSRSSPLPGVLAKLPLPRHVSSFLWAVRSIPSNKWSFKFYIHRVTAFRAHIGVFGILGSILGLAATAYYNLVDKPWWLTNLMGFAFSYTSLQLISPTTFDTGSLILAGLFVYDIVMVFYTPMMVTVAKSLDVPIKLIIPRPENPDKPGVPQYSMLGLGDIVLPGMMIGLALRYDLYRHYLHRQQVEKPVSADATAESNVVKPKYITPGNLWSSRFWTSPWISAKYQLPESVQLGSFKKTYFWTSIVGYVTGMITTLVVMTKFQHAQPALLYLVPGVLISLWGLALIKGDLKEMWNFTEEEITEQKGDEDDKKAGEDEEKKKKSSGSIFFSDEKSERNEARLRNNISKYVQRGESESEGEITGEKKDKSKQKVEKPERKFRRDTNHDLVYFAITRHAPLRRLEDGKSVPKWIGEGEGERPGKRQRTA